MNYQLFPYKVKVINNQKSPEQINDLPGDISS